MPIIEATFVTKTDMSVCCERKKIAAPVIATLAKPSASGSAAAASEPKTASRMIATIGKPARSACDKSSFERSCMPAHSACWPTRWMSPRPRRSPPLPRSNSRRRSTAALAASSCLPATWSGTTVIGALPALRAAPAAALLESVTWLTLPVAPCTWSIAARTSASVAPGLRATTTARASRCAPSNSASPRSTACDPEPGTAKPPLVRLSVCRAANGSAAASSASHASTTTTRWRRVKLPRRSMAPCMKFLGVLLPTRTCERRGIRHSGAEQEPRCRDAGGERAGAVPLGIRDELQLEAVAEREQQRRDGFRLAAQLHDPGCLLRTQDPGHLAARLAVQLAQLLAHLVVVARDAEELVDDRVGGGVVGDEVLELADQHVHDRVDRVRALEHPLEALDPHLGVTPDHLDQQALLRAEVVVQEPARHAGLLGHVVERRAGGAAQGHARAHRFDDAARLVAVEPALGSGSGFHKAESSWTASQTATPPGGGKTRARETTPRQPRSARR